MKICIVDPLKLKGGQEKFIIELATTLQSDFKIFFVSENSSVDINSNFSFLRFGSFYSPISLFKLYKLLIKENINTIVLNGERALFFGTFLSYFLPKISLVYINHLIFDISIKNSLFFKRWFYSKVYSFLIRRVNHFVSICSSNDFKVNNFKYKNCKFYFIDNAIKKVSLFNNIKKSSLNFSASDFVVGFVGRIDIQKGVETLVKSSIYVNHSVKILIIGDGPQLPILQDYIIKQKIKNVTFIGYCDSPWEYSTIMDVIVFPSIYEGLSLSLLEAMSLKIPLIVSNIPSFKYCLSEKKSCLFFEPLNELELSEKINYHCFNKHQMDTLKENAYEIYLKKFIYEDMVFKYKNLFKEIAGTNCR
jgi:glycosyltransferase involved in cell wall biosynthesis